MKNLFYLSILFFMYNSCCKDCTDYTNPQCSNYNPCKGKSEVNAAFEIYDMIHGVRRDKYIDWNYAIDVDTIYSNSATFQALENDAKYEWHIGADVYTTQSINLTDFPNHTNIEVTLIVSKTPNKKCFPNDDGKDTVKRVFHNIFFTYDEPMKQDKYTYTYHRKYRGYFTDKPSEVFDIEMKKGQVFLENVDIRFPSGFTQYISSGRYIDTLFNLPVKDDYITDLCGARGMFWTQGQFQWYECYYNKNWKPDPSFGSYPYSNRKYSIHGQNFDKKKDSIKIRCVTSSDDGIISDRTFIGKVVR
jgi:hypothetical protein